MAIESYSLSEGALLVNPGYRGDTGSSPLYIPVFPRNNSTPSVGFRATPISVSKDEIAEARRTGKLALMGGLIAVAIAVAFICIMVLVPVPPPVLLNRITIDIFLSLGVATALPIGIGLMIGGSSILANSERTAVTSRRINNLN